MKPTVHEPHQCPSTKTANRRDRVVRKLHLHLPRFRFRFLITLSLTTTHLLLPDLLEKRLEDMRIHLHPPIEVNFEFCVRGYETACNIPAKMPSNELPNVPRQAFTTGQPTIRRLDFSFFRCSPLIPELPGGMHNSRHLQNASRCE